MQEVKKTFALKEEHLKLLCHAHVGWNDCEEGAPEIDPKRPYGNSSVHYDVADILGIKLDDEADDFDEKRHEMLRLHNETEDALQIVLQLQTFETGMYELVSTRTYGRPFWRKAE